MFEELIEKIASSLNSHKIPYMIIGGQAVLLYGEPRLTRDIDITLGIGVDSAAALLEAVKKIRLKPLPSDIQSFIRKTWVLPCEDIKSKIRVDFIFSFTPYEQQAIERAKEVKMGRVRVKFASLEDVIIHKIFAGRPRDIEDIENMLVKNTKADISYIKKQLKEFDAAAPGRHLLSTLDNILKREY